MGYIRAEEVLPRELIETLQEYLEGQAVYIPRRSGTRKEWGEGTRIKSELQERNERIYGDWKAGKDCRKLAESYFLSEKTIQRILREEKKKEYRVRNDS